MKSRFPRGAGPGEVLEGLRSILNPLSSTVSLSTRRDEQPAKSDAAD